MNFKKIIATVLTLSLSAAPVCLSANAWKWPWQESSCGKLVKLKKDFSKELDVAKNLNESELDELYKNFLSLKNGRCYYGDEMDQLYFDELEKRFQPLIDDLKDFSKLSKSLNSFNKSNDEKQCDNFVKELNRIIQKIQFDYPIFRLSVLPNEFLLSIWTDFYNTFKKDVQKFF